MKIYTRTPSLHYTQSGNGDCLILLHGFPFNRAMWNTQIESLSSIVQVITPDLPGFGKSSNHADIETMENMASRVLALIEEIGFSQVTLCGLSMGGYVALEFVHRFPEKVRGLILADTRATADSQETQQARLKQAETILELGMETTAKDMIPKLFFRPDHPNNRAEVARIYHMMSQCPPQAAASALRGMASRNDHVNNLRNILVPTLILVGEHDAITPIGDAELMHKHIPNSVLKLIPNSSHLSNIENAEEFNSCLKDFLGKTPSSETHR